MTSQSIETAYALARQRYADHGVDTDAALRRLAAVSVSLHCWQGDDVSGFEKHTDETLSHMRQSVARPDLGGGLAVTGNYPGKARTPDDLRAYQDAHKNGWLKLRVQMAPLVSTIQDAEALANSGVHSGFGDDVLKFGAVKMFADGGMAAKTIAVYEPAQGEPGNLGLLIWKPEDMQKAHRLLASAGWQLETHAIGDRAMDEVLDSYQAVMKDLGLKEPRFRIVHAGFSTPPIQKRLRDLRVLVDANPAFVYWIGTYFSKYGPQRVRWAYPAKSFFDNGIVAAGTSDVPVTPISPWWGIWASVERRELHTGQALAPEERLTVLQALEMYTRNPAYIGFEEKQKGSLEPGKLADFIIVDRDVLSIPPEQLKEVQVLKTFVGGEIVYAKP